MYSVPYYLDFTQMLYLFIIDIIFYQVKFLMFYNVQLTNLTFVVKNMRHSINNYRIAKFQIVNDTNYHI